MELKNCEACCEGKQMRLSFSTSTTKTSNCLELVHSDLCGPMENKSIGGSIYFMTFIDDFSRKVFVYFLKSKTEAFDVFRDFKKLVENQTERTIKIFRTDNGGEFCSNEFSRFLKQNGIIHQTTNPYTPEQNGLAERMNRTIVEKAKCMLFDAKLNVSFWAEAVNTAVYLINRSVASALVDKTPEEIWTGVKPDLSHLRIFGSDCMVHVPKQRRRKWSPKSTKMIFVGYSEDTKGFRMIHPKTKKLVKSRDVIFFEKYDQDDFSSFKLIDADENCDRLDEVFLNESDEIDGDNSNDDNLADTNGIQNFMQGGSATQNFDERDSDEQNLDEIATNGGDSIVQVAPIQNNNVVDNNGIIRPPLRRSSRIPVPRKIFGAVIYFCTSDAEFIQDPETVKQALSSENGNDWKFAMQDEYDSLIDNNTWSLVELPKGKRAIHSKWVFKTKTNNEGQVIRFKARLVVKGCAQRQGLDYQETYSPVIRYTSLRYLLSIAAEFNLNIMHMDAVTAFLQGDLDDEIYIFQPEEFNDGTGRVCKLNRAMYGLRQASRLWNIKLSKYLRKLGFKQSELDPCVYYKIYDKAIIIVAIYVDDLIIFSNDDEMTMDLKTNLQGEFKMKDLGDVEYCVGMHIVRDKVNGKITLDQRKYIEEVLARFNMTDCNPVKTPVDGNKRLTHLMSPQNESEVLDMSKIPYKEAVGCLIHLVQGSRPDIAYAVHDVSKFNKNPGKEHWLAVKRIFRYLKGTLHMKLEYGHDADSNLLGYSDSDYAGELDERRSCTGFVFIRNGGAISWSSKRQETVAVSSTEAEYMALAAATQDALWLRQFEAEFWSIDKPTTILCDNQSAISLANNNAYHSRTRHIDIKHHFVRKKIEKKQIDVQPIGTKEMVADSLTKGLFKEKHDFCSVNMGLKY